ncbi:hypothetical protein WJX84_012355 [Apatococcus fuscideae]|uniref:JmjC domain-containing protein n=1 Tax=Apatococcus fuscideae TaxID=2026836 RepID=A0AAW1THF0_9CHLO
MEDCDRPQEKQCRLCGRCKPLDAFRRRSDSGSLRSECAACQNQDNAGRNKRARVAKAAVHGCETGPRSSTGSANNSCSWREADSSGLIEQDAQLHKLLFCGFRASAHSLDDASTKVLLLETESKQMQQLFEKRLRPILSAEEMRSSGIRIIFQPPGCMVVTLPGEVFHWTMSLGASIAESSNFFTTAGGMSLPGIHAMKRAKAPVIRGHSEINRLPPAPWANEESLHDYSRVYHA